MIDPLIARAILDSFSSMGALTSMGASIGGLDDGFCEVRVPRSRTVTQQHGYFHGGIIGAVGDTAGGYAGNTKVMPARECLTVEYKINITSPADGESLIARARVVRTGRTLIVATVDMSVLRDHVEHQCALLQMTLFVVDRRTTPSSNV